MISLLYLYSASGGFSHLRVSAYISLLENCIKFPEAVMPVGQVRQKQTEIGIPQGIALSQWLTWTQEYTGGPWSMQVWTAQVYLHMNNFPLVNITVLQGLWLF